MILRTAERTTEGNIVAIARMLFLAIAAGSVAVGTATPASARPVDPPMYGVYTYHQDGAPDETWTLWPTCVEAGPALHISSTGYLDVSDRQRDAPDTRRRRTQGRRAVDVAAHQGQGRDVPRREQDTRDLLLFMGSSHARRHRDQIPTSDECGLKPGMTKQSFALTYKEPLPIPVILDPLNQIENLW